jgi:hypothetical protein
MLCWLVFHSMIVAMVCSVHCRKKRKREISMLMLTICICCLVYYWLINAYTNIFLYLTLNMYSVEMHDANYSIQNLVSHICVIYVCCMFLSQAVLLAYMTIHWYSVQWSMLFRCISIDIIRCYTRNWLLTDKWTIHWWWK